jgi:hypothetical protein
LEGEIFMIDDPSAHGAGRAGDLVSELVLCSGDGGSLDRIVFCVLGRVLPAVRVLQAVAALVLTTIVASSSSAFAFFL